MKKALQLNRLQKARTTRRELLGPYAVSVTVTGNLYSPAFERLNRSKTIIEQWLGF